MARNAFEKLAGIKKPRSTKSAASTITKLIGKSSSSAFRPEVSEGFERKPVGIFKLLDLLNRGQYAVVNPLRRATDENRDYTAGEYLKSIWDGLAGNERSYTSDVLENLGWKPETIGGKIGRGAVGLAGDILLDPLTYTGIGTLTKLGKAAKAGAALKVGDAILDLRKGKDLLKATDMLSGLMKKAGEADDVIKNMVTGYNSIRNAGMAKDMAKWFTKYGGKAEAIDLGRNVFKQFKRGQRAMLQLSLPRIFGGASTRVPIIGNTAENAFWRLLSKGQRKLGAARLAADPQALAALHKPSEEMLKLLKNGKAFVVGENIYEATKPGTNGLLKDLFKRNVIDKAQRSALKKTFRKADYDLGKITAAIKETTGLNPKFTFHQFDPVKAAGRWKPLGKTINTASELFNFIPTTVKSIRRSASGASTRSANFVTEQIKKLMGKNSENLVAGTKDFVDKAGVAFTAKDDLLSRIEAIEGLRHTAVQDALDTIRKSRPAKLEEIISSLDLLRPENYTKTDFYQKALDHASKAGSATPIKGLSGQTVDRMQDALRRWGDAEKITKVDDAVKMYQDFAVKAGLAKPDDIFRREMYEGFGYTPHFLEETVRGTKDPRVSHHGQTIFEAVHGLRSKESVRNLVDNWNSVVKRDADGKVLRGRDLLTGEPSEHIREAFNKRDAAIKEILRDPKIYIRDGNGNYIKKVSDRTVADVLFSLENPLDLPGAMPINWEIKGIKHPLEHARSLGIDIDSIEGFQKKLSDLVSKATSGYEKVSFSPDLQRNLILRVQAAQGKMQSKLVLANAIKYGIKIDPLTGKIPPGYVKLTKVIPDDYYKALKRMEGGVALTKQAVDVVVPYSYVKPLQEMMRVAYEEPGAATQAYDWVLSILKPFMLSAPATQVRNFLSSFAMAWAGGDFMSPTKMANFGKVAEYCGSFRKAGGDQLFKIGEKTFTLNQIVEIFENAGGKNMDSVINEFLSRGVKEWDKKAARAVKKGALKVTKLTTGTAEVVEDTFRITHFINCLQDGMTVEDAIESVAMHFYDYSDLSKFETNILRRVFPFYAFWRKNLEANLRYLVTNPGYLNLPTKAANEMNEISEGEPGAFPLEWLENERQQWLANQGAFFVPWNRRIGTMQGILPQADLANISPKDLMEQLTGMLTPVVKLPYETLTNKDTYTGREIETPTKPSVYYLGLDMNPRVHHALRPFRVLDAADYLIKAAWPERAKEHAANVRMTGDETLGQKSWNAVHDILGFRSYLLDPESVQLNKRLELIKLIKRTSQYLDSHPKLSPDIRNEILANKAVLEEELGRTKSVGESDEHVLSTKTTKKPKYVPLEILKK